MAVQHRRIKAIAQEVRERVAETNLLIFGGCNSRPLEVGRLVATHWMASCPRRISYLQPHASPARTRCRLHLSPGTRQDSEPIIFTTPPHTPTNPSHDVSDAFQVQLHNVKSRGSQLGCWLSRFPWRLGRSVLRAL